MDDDERGLGERGRLWGVVLWVLVGCVILAILVGSILLLTHNLTAKDPVEIELPAASTRNIELYLSGAVACEGIYICDDTYSLSEVIRQAGGLLVNDDDTVKVRVRVLASGEDPLPIEEDEVITGPSKININTASFTTLQTLTGIGPVKAQAIVDYRTEHGLFHSVDDLTRVPGIGPITLENVRDQITVID